MALIHCHFHSHVLDMACAMDVSLPQPAPASPGAAAPAPAGERTLWPTLYLLHGLSDDHTIWQRRTNIERYAAPLNLAVVMPAVGRSFYTDTTYSHRYWTFLSEELPAVARSFFPLSPARKDNFVAGLSMGGYGALKLALRHPDRFAAAASLSGALDIAGRLGETEETIRLELEHIFGPLSKLAGTDNDLLHLAAKVAGSPGPRPALYQWCGTEDFLYPHNVRFRDHARRLGLDLTYEEGPGTHEWAHWDRQIQRVLEWLPIENPSRDR